MDTKTLERVIKWWNAVTVIFAIPFMLTWSVATMIDLFHLAYITPDALVGRADACLYAAAMHGCALGLLWTWALWCAFVRHVEYKHHKSTRRWESQDRSRQRGGAWG